MKPSRSDIMELRKNCLDMWGIPRSRGGRLRILCKNGECKISLYGDWMIVDPWLHFVMMVQGLRV